MIEACESGAVAVLTEGAGTVGLEDVEGEASHAGEDAGVGSDARTIFAHNVTAWNSPLLFIAWKCTSALAAGCTVVVKPSEFASASTLEFAALTREAGFPDGVFNVVTGYGQEAGSALVDHPDVAKITFTGSDATGARIYAQAARSLKRVTLELGGKSPNIVFDDCDLDAAAAGVISGIFAATGQTCIAGSRLLVQNSIRDAFSERLVALGTTARKGDPMLADTNIGPVTTAPQYRKILDYIDIAKAEGARCILGGGPATSPDLPGGQFVEPTIFVDVKPEMRIAREEVFGPVLSIIGFDDEAEAIMIREIGQFVTSGQRRSIRGVAQPLPNGRLRCPEFSPGP